MKPKFKECECKEPDIFLAPFGGWFCGNCSKGVSKETKEATFEKDRIKAENERSPSK